MKHYKYVSAIMILMLLLNLLCGCSSNSSPVPEESAQDLIPASVSGGYSSKEVPIAEVNHSSGYCISLRTKQNGDIQAVFEIEYPLSERSIVIDTFSEGELKNSHIIRNDLKGSLLEDKYLYDNSRIVADDNDNLYLFTSIGNSSDISNDMYMFKYSSDAEYLSAYDDMKYLGNIKEMLGSEGLSQLTRDPKDGDDYRFINMIREYVVSGTKILMIADSYEGYNDCVNLVFDTESEEVSWLNNIPIRQSFYASNMVSDGTLNAIYDGEEIHIYSSSDFSEPSSSGIHISPIFNTESSVKLCGIDSEAVYYCDSLGISRIMLGGSIPELILDSSQISDIDLTVYSTKIALGPNKDFYVTLAERNDRGAYQNTLVYLKYDQNMVVVNTPSVHVLDMFGNDSTSLIDKQLSSTIDDVSFRKQIIPNEDRGIYGRISFIPGSPSYDDLIDNYRELQNNIIDMFSSGHGPDVIIADAQTIKLLGENGYLMDLSDNDPAANIPESILNSMSIGENIYAYPLLFQQAAFFSTGNGSYDTSSVQAFTQSIENDESGNYPFYFDDYINMFDRFYMLNQSELIRDDHLDTEKYRLFLQMLKAITDSISSAQAQNNITSYKEAVLNGDPYGDYKLKEGDRTKGVPTEYRQSGTTSFYYQGPVLRGSLFLTQLNNNYTIKPAYDMTARTPIRFVYELFDKLDYDHPEIWPNIQPASIPTFTEDPYVIPIAIGINKNTAYPDHSLAYVNAALDKSFQDSFGSINFGFQAPIWGFMPVNEDSASSVGSHMRSYANENEYHKFFESDIMKVDSIYDDLGDVQIIDHVLMWELSKIADNLFSGSISIDEAVEQSSAMVDSYYR